MIPCVTLPLCRTIKWSVNCHRKAYHLLPRLYSKTVIGSSFLPLDQLVRGRREEAQRSLLVEVAGLASALALHQVCSQYGSVHKMFHYTVNSGNNNKEMILVEFKESSSLDQALQFACSQSVKNIIPAHSPLVWLAAGKSSNETTNAHITQDLLELVTPNIKYSKEELQQQIFQCNDIEVALSGLFPRATVLPFGSSVNSFGNFNCDLDMILELSGIGAQDNTQRLVFQAKKAPSSANSRLALQRRMEIISDIIDNFVPGCSQVRKILNARVPIIKYRQNLTDVDCDLTMSNRSGFYMSQMLYMYGSLDSRVCPLVFAVRRWARDRHITSPYSGRWITNFSLTLMVIFYLMNVSTPVIASLQSLNINSGPDEEEIESDRFIFPKSLEKVAASENKDSLETLLRGFFEFYDQFNFRERGLSIVTGNSFIKPEHNALYIQNPLERVLNVSRNVTLEEVERFRAELTHARYLLEGSTPDVDAERNEPWGALCLWDESTTGIANHRILEASPNYSIDWKEVFHTEDAKGQASSVHEKNASSFKLKSARSNREYKNFTKQTFNENGILGRGMELKNASELKGLVTKLKQKTSQKGNNGRRSKYNFKGKYK
ncbi:poly(A) RNA polymerase, mitochondrial-like isoform X2 [Homarus americanus]|uniref:poly(A) RNA polymerase, mitochondrial-like isoform X2 n=1 Tax=Homarus americanus TaxID=6706 RepID=UPI001C48AFC7|nr:poly(A) RNA polymerase, mitochondrial-like isoform X2 [Homarus americanus]